MPSDGDVRKKVALHIIMPNQVSGPNTSMRTIAASSLAEEYEFLAFTQEFHANGRLNLRLVRDLMRQLREIRPDVVHISGLQAAGLHAVIAARLATRAKVLVTIHGFSADDSQIGPLKRAIFNLIVEPLTLLLCTSFYTVCEAAGRKSIVRLFKRKSSGVIYNAAPSVDFDVRAAREESRRALGIGSDDFVAVVVGRMVKDKGIEYVAEAARSIRLQNLRWLFIGDGPLYECFPEKWPDLCDTGRAILAGKRFDARTLMAAGDVFVFATLHENLSNALLEAMSIGLPVVATSVGGNVEVVQHGVNGALIQPANSAEIAAAVSSMALAASDVLSAYGRASQSIVVNGFQEATLLREVGAVYRSFGQR